LATVELIFVARHTCLNDHCDLKLVSLLGDNVSERLSIKDFVQALLLCVSVCLALLAIKFELFGWVGASACIVLTMIVFSTRQRRIDWRLVIPAIALGGLGYSAASATTVAALL